MGGRTGLGLVDLALLSAIEHRGALPHRPHTKCAAAIMSLDDEGLGLAPAYAYLALCDLAKPWIMNPVLVDYRGALGTRDTPSAGMRMAECRLSPAGACALAAERGEIGPVPLGLMLGNAHLTGHRPPFDAHGVVAAARLVVEDPHVPDAEVITTVGPPSFPTGSRVTGDLDALIDGEWADITVQALTTVDQATGGVVIEHLPPNCTPGRLARILLGRHQADPASDESGLTASELAIPGLVASVDDQSTRAGDRLVCMPTPGTPVGQLLRELLMVREVTTEVRLKLPAPLASVVRQWVGRWNDEDLATSLDLLDASLGEV